MPVKASTESAAALPRYDGEYVRAHVFIDDAKTPEGMALRTVFGAAHGCRGASAELARFAAEALLRGEVDNLVFSGGNVVRDVMTFAGLGWQAATEKGSSARERVRGVFDMARDCFAMKSLRHFYTEAEYMKKVALDYIRKQTPDFDENRIIIENQHAEAQPNSKHVAAGVANLLDNKAFNETLHESGGLRVIQHAYNTRLTASAWVKKLGEGMVVITKSSYPYGSDAYNWEKGPLKSLVYGDTAKVDPDNPDGNFQKFPENFAIYNAEAHAQKALEVLSPVEA